MDNLLHESLALLGESAAMCLSWVWLAELAPFGSLCSVGAFMQTLL